MINTASNRWALPDFREIWLFRHLLWQMVTSEIKAKYKQTILGILWAIINPLITMVVFTFVFNRLAGIQTFGIPYPIFTFAGLVAWQIFAKGLVMSSVSIVASSNIIGKVYFPRMLAPFSKLATGLVDFMFAFGVLFILMIFYGYFPTPRAIFVIYFIFLAIISTFGLGLLLSAMHVRFRDIGQLVPFFIQTLLYLTPVAYPSTLLSDTFRTLYGINPMVTVCDGFRWALLHVDSPELTGLAQRTVDQLGYSMSYDVELLYMPTLIVSTITGFALFFGGMYFFTRLEKSFADLL